MLAVSGCGVANDAAELLQSGQVVDLGGTDGRWVGPVTPEGTECGGVTTGLMRIGRGRFGFDPFQSTAVLRGEVDAQGHLAAVLERVGGEKKVISMRFEARVLTEGAGIKGGLESGKCRWQVLLKRG